jgi:hypothetical protein
VGRFAQNAPRLDELGMTEFLTAVSLDDRETEALERAFRHYLEVCRREIKKGAPSEGDRLVITRLRATLRKKLKKGRRLIIGDGEIGPVQRALQSYLESCGQAGPNDATISDKTIIPKVRATLERDFERAVINGSIRLAALMKL